MSNAIALLAHSLAARIPAFAQDCVINNAHVIEKEIEACVMIAMAEKGVLLAGCRISANPSKSYPGIGMPSCLYLHEFGEVLSHAFDGAYAYQVGSSLFGSRWRDVDIRIMLDDEKYAAMGFGDPDRPHSNAKWCAYTMAFSELGRRMTGLPIDFQVQQTTWANNQYAGNEHGRSALIVGLIRRQKPEPP
jgi:hypothetical protein